MYREVNLACSRSWVDQAMQDLFRKGAVQAAGYRRADGPCVAEGICLAKYGFAVGLLLIVLAFAPGADLFASRLFYAGGHFLGNGRIGYFARDVTRLAPLLLFGVVALLYIARRLGWIAARRAPDGRSMLFLALSLALGPGLLVNGVFKTYVHRPRPAQVQQFGGTLDFQPYYRRDGGCSRNCSFPSGEAAAAFWTVAPASLAPLPWQPALMAAAVLFGVATGLLRMASGGHFLSDVLGASFLMLIVVAGIRRLLRLPPSAPRHEESDAVSPDTSNVPVP